MSLITINSWNKLIQCQKTFYTPLMAGILNNIEQAMQCPLKILKSDQTSTVVVVEVGAQLLVIKRANTKSVIHYLRRLFLPSRARKNWQNAEKLQQLGISTFSPIALIEERIGPLRGRSYFLCTYIEGTPALEYFRDKSKRTTWALAARNLVTLSERLAQNWVSHRDLNLSNIIFTAEKPSLIDLDAMRQYASPRIAARAARRERHRFLQNCLETPGVSAEINSLLQAAFS